MKLKKFNELYIPEEMRPGYSEEDKKYSLTAEQVSDIVHTFSGATIPIEEVKRELKQYESVSEGKAEKASKNPYGNKTKEDKKDQLRKSVEDHIKNKECKTKQVGDDFEIHFDGEHIAQVMFRDEKITVKKKGEKFGKEFKYNELGKIKAEITSVIKDCE